MHRRGPLLTPRAGLQGVSNPRFWGQWCAVNGQKWDRTRPYRVDDATVRLMLHEAKIWCERLHLPVIRCAGP
jgi:hypothetical protein